MIFNIHIAGCTLEIVRKSEIVMHDATLGGINMISEFPDELIFFMPNTSLFTLHTLTYKCGVVPSVSTAQDEMQAKSQCRKVYGPEEWRHCLHVAIEMCMRREKISSYTGNYFWDSHPSRFTFGRSPSIFWANVILFFLHMNLFSWVTESRRERGEVFLMVEDNLSSCCQECGLFSLFLMYNTHESLLYTVIGNIYLPLTTHSIFMSGDVRMYA